MKKIVKIIIRYIYRFIFYRKFFNVYENKNVTYIYLNQPGFRHTFFGYYTNQQFNKTDTNLIYCTTNSNKLRATGNEKIYIGLYNLKNKSYKIISSSLAWNWQQGSMAQWLADKDCIIYNNYCKKLDSYFSEVINIFGEKIASYNLPIYKVAPNGKYALTLNFKRLAQLRPDYGYFCHRNKTILNDREDGIFHIDLIKGTCRILISIQFLKSFDNDDTMYEAFHKVNHIDISPNSERFLFLHRWYKHGIKYTRLLSAKHDGTDLKVHKGNRFVSHNCWFKNNNIISFTKYDDRIGYVLIEKLDNKFKPFLQKLHFDGHPNVNPNEKYLVTDLANPNIIGFKTLFLFSFENLKLIEIGNFYLPFKFNGEKRVDLHPRWNNQGNLISVDMVCKNKRTIAILDISKLL